MSKIDPDWLREFDAAMKKLFAIDSEEAGLDENVLLRYADLTPRGAALQYAEDYDLQRVDIDWLSI